MTSGEEIGLSTVDTLDALPGHRALVARPRLRRVLPADETKVLLTDAPAFYAADTADLLRSALVVASRGAVDAPGGLSRIVRRFTYDNRHPSMGFRFARESEPDSEEHDIDVAVRVLGGQLTSTWSWRAEATTERAVAGLARLWSAALTGIVKEVRSATPIPSVLEQEPVEVQVDLPATVSPDRVRIAVTALLSRYPYLATRRHVGDVAFAVPDADAALVKVDLTRTNSARARLTIAANPLLVGDLVGLARELCGEIQATSGGGPWTPPRWLIRLALPA